MSSVGSHVRFRRRRTISPATVEVRGGGNKSLVRSHRTAFIRTYFRTKGGKVLDTITPSFMSPLSLLVNTLHAWGIPPRLVPTSSDHPGVWCAVILQQIWFVSDFTLLALVNFANWNCVCFESRLSCIILSSMFPVISIATLIITNFFHRDNGNLLAASVS
jgi:hypothetical protein